MNARTKLHRKWHRELMAEWQSKGINSCELCGDTFGQALAHSKKRRMIENKEDYWTVALLCQKCHTIIEHSGHANMEREILAIIERRGYY